MNDPSECIQVTHGQIVQLSLEPGTRKVLYLPKNADVPGIRLSFNPDIITVWYGSPTIDTTPLPSDTYIIKGFNREWYFVVSHIGTRKRQLVELTIDSIGCFVG